MSQATLKRIGPVSLAKIQGVVLLVVGFLIGIPYGLFMMLFGAMFASQSAEAAGGMVVIGLGIMIGFPILYGIMGFLGGLITAAIYNLAARTIGGINLELELEPTSYSPPPPPPQW